MSQVNTAFKARRACRRALLFIVLGVVPAASSAGADTRTWARIRYDVCDLDGDHVADLTVIQTLDGATPSYLRYLLQDANSKELTVLRFEKDSDGAVHVSIARASGETLFTYSVDARHAGVVDYCGAHLTWSDTGPVASLPRAFKVGVASAVAACPGATSSTLKRLAMLGAQYIDSLPTTFLEDLMYPSIEHLKLGKLMTVSKTHPFDPTKTAPDSFEQQFGSAYYK